MDIKKYLDRIDYTGDTTPSIDVLTQLQEAHLLQVPFENLDIHYNNPIYLDLERMYRKVIDRRRGGFCYELNGLFHYLLTSLGFKAHRISGRVYNDKKEVYGPEYDHLAILVSLNGAEYLADVGFGEFALHPLKFELNSVQSDPRGNFLMEGHEKGYYRISKLVGETKSIEYIFKSQERKFHEFTEMCHYMQTSPDSHFTHKKLITRPTPTGRITLSGTTLKVTEGDSVKEEHFAEEEFGAYLKKWFGIDESSL